MNLPPGPQVGEILKNFKLATTAGDTISLDDLVGRPLVIFVYLADGSPSCATMVRSFRDLHGEFDGIGVKVLGLGLESIESHRKFAAEHDLPFPLLSDPEGKTAGALGAFKPAEVSGGQENVVALSRTTILTDAAFRVVKRYEDVVDPHHAQWVLDDAKAALCQESARDIVYQAPVLLIPNALPLELCQRLMQTWETEGNEDSGSMKQIDGKTVGVMNYDHKIRRDHYVQNGSALEKEVTKYISTRVLPEIAMAFNFKVTRKEDFRIACYDSARGGYFRPHRDNTTEGTAHRRFAMSLLLNNEYEGGYVRFPEFGPHRYRPKAGGAVVFSCSLLHEATDVTAGRRFVLLSFLYGEAEAKLREAYNQKIGGGYRAGAMSH